jgi:phage tail sheath protein FI
MPQYLSPGVYVEEVKSSVQPIAGVGTSTAGFIGQVDSGVANNMPVQPGKFEVDSLGKQVLDSQGKAIPLHYDLVAAGVPTLITSWEQFKNWFGNFQPGNKTLAHAVYGFFNNGGTRCWVVRTDGSTNATVDALEQFEAIDEIALVVVPGATSAEVQSFVISHCERVGDRFAILDGQNTGTLTPAAIQGSTGNSNYAAMYYPRIQVFDPVTGGPDYVFPSGHIAGIYARVDTLRGVHKAPANEVVRGALGVERRLSRADQEGLNPAGINVIRELNGNILVWGARTLGGDANTEWKYINVRRLFLFLRESIDEGTQWVVFEPNDTALWSKISRNVTAFLTNVWRSGALFGNTPQEAFYVRCDATTNPPEVRDLGQVVTEIGVAVVKPAEFVIFRISQWAGPGK